MKRFSILVSMVALTGLIISPLYAQGRNTGLHPYSYNENRTVVGNMATSEFSITPMNYVDAEGSWQAIDLKFSANADGFHITKAPYELHLPRQSSGDMRFVATNRYSIAERKVRSDAPLEKIRRFTSVADVPGTITPEGVLYEGALASIEADLLVQPDEVEARYLVKWDERPAACSDSAATIEIPFVQEFDGGIAPRVSDKQGTVPGADTVLKDGFYIAANEFRAITTPPAKIWDSGPSRSPVGLVGRWTDDALYGKKVIDCAFFNDAVFPVYTDDTDTIYVDSGGVDAGVECDTDAGCSSTPWSTMRSASTGNKVENSSANLIGVTHYTSPAQRFGIRRYFFHFDISSINSGADVSSVDMKVYSKTGGGSADNDGYDYLTVLESTAANDTSIATSDYDNCGTLNSPTKLSGDVDISDIVSGEESLETWSLNTSGITVVENALGGVVKLCLREGHDIEDIAPDTVGNTLAYMYMSENAGTTNDPRLVLTYEIGNDLSLTKTGPATADSGALLTYTLTATNNSPSTATGITITDEIPPGFTFSSANSSADCSQNGGNIECGTFELGNGASTGRTIAFTASTGTCGGQLTNTGSIAGSQTDFNPANDVDTVVTTINCPDLVTSIRKSSDENVTSSTTLQNDDALAVSLEANKEYVINGAIFATSTSAQPDIKFAFTTPAGTTMDIGYVSHNIDGNPVIRAGLLETSGAASENIPIKANNIAIIQLFGTVSTTTNDGTLQLQWAQANSNATATTMKEGAFLSISEAQ